MGIGDKLDQSFGKLSQQNGVTSEQIVETLEQIKAEEPGFDYSVERLPSGSELYHGKGRKSWRLEGDRLQRTDDRFRLNPEWKDS